MSSVENFIKKHFGIDSEMLFDWEIKSSALCHGLITNSLVLMIGKGTCPVEKVGSLMPIRGTSGEGGKMEILLLKGKETSELFEILAKTMFVGE